MATKTVPASQTAMQNMAHSLFFLRPELILLIAAPCRACIRSRSSSPDQSFRSHLKSFRKICLDSRAITFHRPLSIGKQFRDCNSNTRPIVSFDKRFKKLLARLLTYFGDGVYRGNPHIIVVVLERLHQNRRDLGSDMPFHGL